jgi:hypothetical protein
MAAFSWPLILGKSVFFRGTLNACGQLIEDQSYRQTLSIASMEASRYHPLFAASCMMDLIFADKR